MNENVNELLNMIDEALEEGRKVPFMESQRIVDIEAVHEILDEIRRALPDEIRGFKMPEPVQRPLAVDIATQPPAGEPVPEVAVIAYVTPAKRAALVAWCKENGIRGRAISTHGRALVIKRWDE